MVCLCGVYHQSTYNMYCFTKTLSTYKERVMLICQDQNFSIMYIAIGLPIVIIKCNVLQRWVIQETSAACVSEM